MKLCGGVSLAKCVREWVAWLVLWWKRWRGWTERKPKSILMNRIHGIEHGVSRHWAITEQFIESHLVVLHKVLHETRMYYWVVEWKIHFWMKMLMGIFDTEKKNEEMFEKTKWKVFIGNSMTKCCFDWINVTENEMRLKSQSKWLNKWNAFAGDGLSIIAHTFLVLAYILNFMLYAKRRWPGEYDQFHVYFMFHRHHRLTISFALYFVCERENERERESLCIRLSMVKCWVKQSQLLIYLCAFTFMERIIRNIIETIAIYTGDKTTEPNWNQSKLD